MIFQICSVLSKVKDPVPVEKWPKVVHRIPCSCGKACIGDLAWKDHQSISSEEATVVVTGPNALEDCYSKKPSTFT